MINLWLIGLEKKHIPSLQKLSSSLFEHFDKGKRNNSRMKKMMVEVEHFTRLKDVWIEGS